MKFASKDFFSKCDQIRRNLRIWSHLLKKSLMENYIFCAVIQYFSALIREVVIVIQVAKITINLYTTEHLDVSINKVTLVYRI